MNMIEKIMALVADNYAATEVGATDKLRAAIEQAIKDEREQCAKICDEISERHWKIFQKGDPLPSLRADPCMEGKSYGADDCAEAIRAR